MTNSESGGDWKPAFGESREGGNQGRRAFGRHHHASPRSPERLADEKGTRTANPGQAIATERTAAQYSPDICQSPKSWECRSNSDVSMNNDVKNRSPPETSSPGHSPANSTAQRFGHLHVSHKHVDIRARAQAHVQGVRGRSIDNATPPTAGKRAASRELPVPPARSSPGAQGKSPRRPASSRKDRPGGRGPETRKFAGTLQGRPSAKPQGLDPAFVSRALRYDSGYVSRGSTWNQPGPQLEDASRQQHDSGRGHQLSTHLTHDDDSKPVPSTLADVVEESRRVSEPRHQSKHGRKPQENTPNATMILQPESSLISQDQLAAEIKGIYAGLVMVEAKCMSLDAAQAADKKAELSSEQWEALIALHRTLLYEHHDFLMATQHPAANCALARLAVKYSMPARMWKHGIHAFLEVLRHRRPASQEYMLSFLYLAYSMMALLYETVPTFVDTWVECLGDLARYRMAIEEDRETHALWGGVAARWYTMAADRHPSIGRLCHHLGILERPSMHKLFFYAKALTSVVPFPNTKESLATLCGPIVNDDKLAESRKQSAEACAITYHAFVSFNRMHEAERAASQALQMLRQLPAARWKDIGTSLAITNVASILGFGARENEVHLAFIKDVQNQARNDPSSTQYGAVTSAPPASTFFDTVLSIATAPANQVTINFAKDSFALALKHHRDRESLSGVLPFVHTNLIWLHSLASLRFRCSNDNDTLYMIDSLTAAAPWVNISRFLNALTRFEPITDRLESCARQRVFLRPERQGQPPVLLQEDFAIRGLVWTTDAFPSDRFAGLEDDDGSRAIETPVMRKLRAERVVFEGLCLADLTDFLSYDSQTRQFYARGSSAEDLEPLLESMVADDSPKSSSSGTVSGASDVGGGFKAVRGPKPRKTSPPKTKSQKTYASVASAGRNNGKPVKHDTNVAIKDEETAKWGEQPYGRFVM